MSRPSLHHAPDAPLGVRKWNRGEREERLRSAVFAALAESGARLVSPSDIARHARVSKALIYKHFGSVEALVDDAIRSRLQLLDAESCAECDANMSTSERVSGAASKLYQVIQSQPELINLVGWSMGNPHSEAQNVAATIKVYCENLAKRIDAGAEAATLFMGVFAALIFDQQNRAAEPERDESLAKTSRRRSTK